MKSSVYPAVIIASLVGLGVLVLAGWLNFSISIEPIEPETSSSPDIVPSTSPPVAKKRSPTTEPLSSTPAGVGTDQTSKQELPPVKVVVNPDALRISNQTEQPVRVALLAGNPASTSSRYKEPAHWDFAPGEGSLQGLLLSLPEGNLQLEKGDILVVFAQDGSRRYWGPYVVGETKAPVRDRQTGEWQLILQP